VSETDGVQGPFPGPNWMAECLKARLDVERLQDELRGCDGALRAAQEDIQRLRLSEVHWQERAVALLQDLKAAVVNRDRRDEGAQAQPTGAAVAPTGQAGGEYSGSAGPPAGLRIPPSVSVAAMVVLAPGGEEILRVPAGVTPTELYEQGFPDVAAALEKGPKR
jgi:hypothetical protein